MPALEDTSLRWIGKSPDGSTVTLRRLPETPALVSSFDEAWMQENAAELRVGLALDVETTGLEAGRDQIIEIGLRAFRFHRLTGELVAFDEAYNGLQDPGVPLSEEIVRLTGITDADLAGQSIDWAQVTRMIETASLVIAHNAAFDRGFVDRVVPVSRSRVWACSLKLIDWREKGLPSQKLEFLSIYHGFFTDAHRALNDANALVYLLSLPAEDSDTPYLLELIENARRTQFHVAATGSPFESKDALRLRGYSWDAAAKVWHKFIFEEDHADELEWLQAEVYKGASRAQFRKIALVDNFKSLG